ncbi:MAG: DUF362 domain-containing protein [Lachnospiraceae bacterium]
MLHSGEKGNQNFLGPDFWRPVIEKVGGTVVECNTAYDGARDTTAKHRLLIKEHGWDRYFNVDLMDAEGPDMELAISNGKQINKNFVGKNMANYDSMLVLSHFKGHPMGGYGGALKQLSIGCASSYGKGHTSTELEIRLQSGQRSRLLSNQWQMQHPLLLNTSKAILSMSM